MIGQHDRNPPFPDPCVETMYVETIVLHDAYGKEYGNDIALIKLTGRSQYAPIEHLDQPGDGTWHVDGTKLVLAGWGRISTGDPNQVHGPNQVPEVFPNKAQHVTTPVADCGGVSPPGLSGPPPTTMMCTGTTAGSATGGCHGDSGGPLFAFGPDGRTRTLVGVQSWVTSGCYWRTGYARVQNYTEWICQKTEGVVCSPSIFAPSPLRPPSPPPGLPRT